MGPGHSFALKGRNPGARPGREGNLARLGESSRETMAHGEGRGGERRVKKKKKRRGEWGNRARLGETPVRRYNTWKGNSRETWRKSHLVTSQRHRPGSEISRDFERIPLGRHDTRPSPLSRCGSERPSNPEPADGAFTWPDGAGPRPRPRRLARVVGAASSDVRSASAPRRVRERAVLSFDACPQAGGRGPGQPPHRLHARTRSPSSRGRLTRASRPPSKMAAASATGASEARSLSRSALDRAACGGSGHAHRARPSIDRAWVSHDPARPWHAPSPFRG